MDEMDEALKAIADEHRRKKAAEEKRIADSKKAMAQAPGEWEQILKALSKLSGKDLGGGVLCAWSEPGEFGYGDYFARMNHGISRSDQPENWGEIKIHDRNHYVLKQHSALTPSIDGAGSFYWRVVQAGVNEERLKTPEVAVMVVNRLHALQHPS
jgi:hypothetical protein